MELQKERCYSALNADELKAGDKVIVADTITYIKECLKQDKGIYELIKVQPECYGKRFVVSTDMGHQETSLAYLVEREANCTNCLKSDCECSIEPGDPKCNWCEEWQPKAEPKTEKKCNHCIDCKYYTDILCSKHIIHPGSDYIACGDFVPKGEKKVRPFKDTDELIEEWDKKLGYRDPTGLANPYIWVKYKYDENSKGSLITDFTDDHVYLGDKEVDTMTMYDLFINYTFLDGSPCGVEE